MFPHFILIIQVDDFNSIMSLWRLFFPLISHKGWFQQEPCLRPKAWSWISWAFLQLCTDIDDQQAARGWPNRTHCLVLSRSRPRFRSCAEVFSRQMNAILVGQCCRIQKRQPPRLLGQYEAKTWFSLPWAWISACCWSQSVSSTSGERSKPRAELRPEDRSTHEHQSD